MGLPPVPARKKRCPTQAVLCHHAIMTSETGGSEIEFSSLHGELKKISQDTVNSVNFAGPRCPESA